MNTIRSFNMKDSKDSLYYFKMFFYFYIFVMPWNFFNGQMGTLTIILFVWWLYLNKEYKFYRKLINLPTLTPLTIFLVFLGWSYLSLLWTEDFEWAKISLKFYKYYWFLIPIVLTAITKEEAIKSLYVLSISLGIYSLFSISIFLDIIQIHDQTTNPNSPSNPRGILAYAVVTPFMAISFFFSLLIYIFDKRRIRYLFLFFTLTSFIAIFINNGRAGQLAFFATIIIFLIVNRKYFLNLKTIAGAFIVIFLGISTLQYTGKLDRMLNAFSKELLHAKENNFSGSWGTRAYMWYAAYHLIPKHPFIGAGTGDHINEFIEFTKTHPSEATWLRSFHNQHLDTLMKYGLIGYILLWGSVIYLLYLLRKMADVFIFSLGLAFCSITFFDGIGDIILLMKPYNNLFILIFLLLCSLLFSSKKVQLENTK